MTDYDPRPTERRPFNLMTWIEDHRDELTPPVSNKQVWREADMIVMGAFHHSRWREFILGGVTLTMLEEATIPLFMAH